MNFLSKPFRRRDLALKVREALEAQGALLEPRQCPPPACAMSLHVRDTAV